MVQAPRRTALTGSALMRLLGRLAEAGAAPATPQSFPERLGQWLGWADAISLHAALGGSAAPAAAAAAAPAAAAVQAVVADSRRLRSELAQAAHGVGSPPADDAEPGFAPYRRQYRAQQQSMDTAIGPLRARLRAALAAQSAAGARLAEVDAVMAQVLAPQERRLLATVPALLESHQRRLAAQHAESGPAAWQPLLRQDMQAVLLAELDIRFQPVEGLLAALGAGHTHD